MFKQRIAWIGAILLLTVLLTASAWGKEYEYIDINDPYLRKIPMAIPPFTAISGGGGESQVAGEASGVLSSALEFTGYFKMLDPGAFLIDPKTYNIAAPNFPNWTSIGSELLITGGVLIKDQYVELELRLFDTVKGQTLVGKRYKGWKEDLRQIIHRFAGEVMFTLTGDRGVFGSKIAFISTGSGNKEIFISEFDGQAPRQFTQERAITLSPAWSSDGNWLAYTSYRKGKPDLYIRHLKQKRGAVVAKEGINATPAWVPGKFELAATLSMAGDTEIYLLTGSGKIIKRITNARGIDVSPTWSPDGKKLAFVSNRSGNPQIYVKELSTGREWRLTYEGKYNTTPSWSPQGDRIAYCGSDGGRFNIYVTDVEGSRFIRLTQDSGDNESPSWSPDGGLIAFSSNREGPSRIYVMTAQGTDQRRLLALPGEQFNPKWSPRFTN